MPGIWVGAPAPSLVHPIPSQSCHPILEPSLFPGIVTRSSCVWLQTEQEREPGAHVCVPAVAQATWGQPEAAKTTNGQGRAHGTAALGRHGQPSLPPSGWVSGQRGSHCSVPLNTTRLGASVRMGFYCSAGLQHPLVWASQRQREAVGVQVRDLCRWPGNTKLSRGASQGWAGSILAAPALTAPQGLSFLRCWASSKAWQPRGKSTGGEGRRRLWCNWCRVKASPREVCREDRLQSPVGLAGRVP